MVLCQIKNKPYLMLEYESKFMELKLLTMWSKYAQNK